MAEKITLATLKKQKSQKQPITMVTCYDFASAVLAQQGGIDSLLIGDSLAQLMLGHSSTINATMEIMVALSAAVRRGAPDVYLIGDMPFLSYQVSIEKAIVNAGEFLTRGGCDCVKVEVDHRHLPTVSALAAAGIPVMAHLGLRPQSIGQIGKYAVQGKTAGAALELAELAKKMEAAGACSILLECVLAQVAGAIAERTELPVISCGSGLECDGQVLVWHDLLDLPGAGTAKFTKKYAKIGSQIQQAIAEYADEVRQKRFPQPEHCYNMKPEELRKFKDQLQKSDS